MTKKNFSDMCLYKLAGGTPDAAFLKVIDERDIWDSLEHKVNAAFKLSQFSQNLPSGATIPDNLFIATYEDIAITRTSNERSKITLPVMPISLPMGMGVVEIRPQLNVVDSGDKMLGNPLVPLQSGQDYLLSTDKLLNSLQGKWGYTLSGKTVTITKDLTVFDITKADVKLVVFDMSGYSITDDMPIPADMIGQFEDETIKEFAPVAAEAGYVNIWTNSAQEQNVNK
jgi:hypothetical protein